MLCVFTVSWAFIDDVASQVGDVNSSRTTGLTPSLQRSSNVPRRSLLLTLCMQKC